MTAVYRKNGDCLFIRNFTDTLTIEDDSQPYDITEFILELRAIPSSINSSSQVLVYSHAHYIYCTEDKRPVEPHSLIPIKVQVPTSNDKPKLNLII